MKIRNRHTECLMVAAALFLCACGGDAKVTAVDAAGTDQQGAETATPDVAADINQPSVPDGGPVGGSDASLDAGVACAPLPTGGPTPAGTAPMQAAGPIVVSTAMRPELSAAVADGSYTIRKALAQGGTITVAGADGGVSLPDGGVAPSAPVTYSVFDNWDPVANGIGNPATFTPMFTVAADGSGTHKTIDAAIAEAVFLATCSRVYIRIMPGVYRGQVNVPSKTSAPPLTLYSTESDASKTTIVFNASASLAGNMSASATLTIKALSGFQMKNLTVTNDYVEGSIPGDNQSGVALLNQSDRAQFENVRVLGNIGTLYLKSLDQNAVARSYFRDSYVEGDQDVILGRGTAVFDHTEIKYLSGRQAMGGVIAYPSTVVFNRYGFLFESCQFSAEAGATGVFLGHQWLESDLVVAVGKMIVRNSTLGGHIAATPWSTLGNRLATPKNPAGTAPVLVFTSDDYYPSGNGPVPTEPYLAEYGNTGPGAQR
ncbi:MAG: hypothetical protein H7X95_00405 [Deltaproteobacteria bacterium]|nr:hypothetical protein [Deltaproteobacteria bacterium]